MSKPRAKTWHRQAKAKGREAENDVVSFLRERGVPAERRRLAGVQDMGDISGWPGVVCEVKACKAMDLAGWSGECAAETINAMKKLGEPHVGLVIAKRRGETDVREWYAILGTELAFHAIQALLRERAAKA